jgi:hypothetical protein
MRSMLGASVLDSQVRRKKKGMTKRTKEAKVTSVNDRLCIFFASQVIQGTEVTPDVSNAKYSTMDGVN